jgi:hypothetical protein
MNGLCDAAGVLDVLGDLADPNPVKRRDQIALLQGRLVDCARRIGDARSHPPASTPTPYWIASFPPPTPAAPARTPSPVCIDPPPATTASNRFALYENLQRCVSQWAMLSAVPSPEPAASTLPSVAAAPTFYVFAVGAADATTASMLIRAAAARLAGAANRSGTAPSPRIVVSGRADWTSLDSFAAQCQLDPNTRGALVVETSLPETYRNNFFLIVANFTTVSAAVDMLGCGSEDHTPASSPLSLISRQDVTGKAHQDAWTLGIFTTLATLFAANTSKTTVTIGNGSTTVSKTDASAPVLTGTVLGYFENQNLTLPAQNASVGLKVAAERFAAGMMSRLHAACFEPEIRQLAAAADPAASPAHRTRLYRAAYEYRGDCASFANFDSP